jgi:hypothetical protein
VFLRLSVALKEAKSVLLCGTILSMLIFLLRSGSTSLAFLLNSTLVNLSIKWSLQFCHEIYLVMPLQVAPMRSKSTRQPNTNFMVRTEAIVSSLSQSIINTKKINLSKSLIF